VVTATLASWFVERVQSSQKTEERLTRDHINELVDEVTGLRADLAVLAERLAGPYIAAGAGAAGADSGSGGGASDRRDLDSWA
jgi:hypothetical protein